MKNFIGKKQGNILTENVIFIILNILFLAILVVFLFSKMGNPAVLEEKYAKEIALALDSAKPGMIITLQMKDAIKSAQKENYNLDRIVRVGGNVVTVQLRQDVGYSYSFFNDVNVTPHANVAKQEYFFTVNQKQEVGQ